MLSRSGFAWLSKNAPPVAAALAQTSANSRRDPSKAMDSTRSAAQQTLDSELGRSRQVTALKKPDYDLVLYDLSQLLNTQLDREQLATCVAMIENGVNPEALAVCTANVRSMIVQ